MSMYTVSKELKWEAAHRLIGGYPGNCKYLHGHSYVAVVEILLRPGQSLDQYGFVKDFHDFRPLKEWVDNHWDHATLVAAQDQILLSFVESQRQKCFIFDGNPTAENIARYLFEQAERVLNDERVKVLEVRVKETCTSEAKYHLN